MADDIETGGPTWTVLESHAGAAVGRRARAPAARRRAPHGAGRRRARARRGTTRPSAATATRRRRGGTCATSLAQPPAEVLDALTPPAADQRGRALGLARPRVPHRSPATTGLPLRLLELGSSAGLNLRVDRYWYEQDGVGLGRPRVRGALRRPLAGRRRRRSARRRRSHRVPAAIATRSTRRSPESALTLLSYVWPDQAERLAAPARRARHRGGLPRRRRARADRGLAARAARRRRCPASRPWCSTRSSGSTSRADPRARCSRRSSRGRGAGRPRTRRSPTCGSSRRPRRTSRPSCASRPGPARRLRDQDRVLATSGFHFGPVTWLA